MNTELSDKKLTCVDCGSEFTFTSGEQGYFQSKALSEPKRCPECRAARRLRIVPDSGQGVRHA